MLPYIAEFLGTMMLILLGDGVVANVTLNKSGMKGAGSIQITFAWGLAVMVPAFIFGADPAPASTRLSRWLLLSTVALTGRLFPDISSPSLPERSAARSLSTSCSRGSLTLPKIPEQSWAYSVLLRPFQTQGLIS